MIYLNQNINSMFLRLFIVLSFLVFLPPFVLAETSSQTVVEDVVKHLKNQVQAMDKEEAEAKSIRPHEWARPTEINFFGFIVDIDSVNDTDQNFEMNVYIQLRWLDKRLADPDGTTRQVDIDDIWNPRLLITNLQGRAYTGLPRVAIVSPEGEVIYRQRYTGKVSQPLDLSNFPLDRHLFTIQFAAAGYSSEEMKFLPDEVRGFKAGSMADDLSLPDWNVLSFKAKASPYEPVKGVSSAGFVLQFEASRLFAYYIWQVLLPFSVVIVMSWAAFWVGRENLGIRIGVATSSILTLIANRFVISTLLPKLPYMTRLDFFSVGATLLVLLALVAVVVGSCKKSRRNLYR